jgi:hypothetical protein
MNDPGRANSHHPPTNYTTFLRRLLPQAEGVTHPDIRAAGSAVPPMQRHVCNLPSRTGRLLEFAALGDSMPTDHHPAIRPVPAYTIRLNPRLPIIMRSNKGRINTHHRSHRDVGKEAAVSAPKRRYGVEPRDIEEFPAPLFTSWIEPANFHEALSLHMQRHGDTCWHLARAIALPGERIDRATLNTWTSGKRVPRSVRSMDRLARIERRYRLPTGYFKGMLPNPDRAAVGHHLPGVSPAERRRLAWHLPDDFDRRPAIERDAILDWVRTVVISGATD